MSQEFTYKPSFVDKYIQVLVGIDSSNKIHKMYYTGVPNKIDARKSQLAVEEYVGKITKEQTDSQHIFAPTSVYEYLSNRNAIEKALALLKSNNALNSVIRARRPLSETIIGIKDDGEVIIHETNNAKRDFPKLLQQYTDPSVTNDEGQVRINLKVFERYTVIRDISDSIMKDLSTSRSMAWNKIFSSIFFYSVILFALIFTLLITK